MTATILFAKHLHFIAAVTEALNGLAEQRIDDFYVYVELRHEGSHEKAGSWCDEISPTDWYFDASDGAQ